MTETARFSDDSRRRVTADPPALACEGSITADREVSVWCTSLRAVAVFNVLIWMVTCLPLASGGSLLAWQVALSGTYVGVCAFRAWLPRIDLERYCIHDGVLSSSFVGRSLATVAEVCFAAQIALCLHHVATTAGLSGVALAAYFVVPPLVLAQVFCWHSILTLNHLGHVIENSLWTVTMGGVGVCLVHVAVSGNLDAGLWLIVCVDAALALVFVTFMTWVDVPMYIDRWRASRRERRRYLSLRDGLRDSLQRRVVTRSWSHWRPEVAWLSGYFSVAVWLSLSLVFLSIP